jgi:DNA-binding MarR family transcriptional regulator
MTRAAKSHHAEPSTAGQFAFDGLDRTIHEKARLGILTSLVSRSEGLLFGELKELCALTDGNLNRHLKVLEDAGLIEIWKGFRRNRPQTLVKITRLGKQRFTEYLAELERVVAEAAKWTAAQGRSATGTDASPLRWGLAPG